MKVLLLVDVKKVGRRGEVIDVADGYANNVLIPKKFGIVATSQTLKRVAEDGARAKERQVLSEAVAHKVLKELDGKSVTIKAKANDSGTLFKAIHEKEILEAIEKQCGVSIDPDSLQLLEPIKKTGSHPVVIVSNNAKATVIAFVEG